MDAPWTHGRVPGTVQKGGAQGTIKDMLERICLSSGLGAPQASSIGAGKHDWEEGSLGVSAEDVTSKNHSFISLR